MRPMVRVAGAATLWQPGHMNLGIRTVDRTLVVTINRPERRNAIDGPTADDLHRTFVGFDADDTLDVAVLAGANGTFCAGADLHAIAEGNGNRVDAIHLPDGKVTPWPVTGLAAPAAKACSTHD